MDKLKSYKNLLLIFWFILLVVIVLFIEGYSGWLALAAWVAASVLAAMSYRDWQQKQIPNISRYSVLVPDENEMKSPLSNLLLKAVSFYLAMALPLLLAMDSHEVTWWMHLLWLSMATFCAYLHKRNSHNSG
ncbi:hypothetical protein [Planctobacterium marinum]|uniref:hypothetical protein n=1 Tax=Planctobacterium marinum TaxID=1631968 RepID=UPI0030C6FCB0